MCNLGKRGLPEAGVWLPRWQEASAGAGRVCYDSAMTTLRVHFDGKVLVPEEPVDLPRDCTLEVQVREAKVPSERDLPIGIHPVSGFPYFKVSPGAKPITLEDVRRAEDEI
jgi:hypothetical protein